MSTLGSKSHRAIGSLVFSQLTRSVIERCCQGTVPISAVCVFCSSRLVHTMCPYLQERSTSLPLWTGYAPAVYVKQLTYQCHVFGDTSLVLGETSMSLVI